MTSMRVTLAALCVAVLAIGVYSCKDMGNSIPPLQQLPTLVSFRSEIQPIFTASCVNAGCHPGNGAPFSLASGVSRGNLVGVDMFNGACGGKRVVIGDANASGLYKKVSGNSCGNQMPLSGTPLSASQISLIRDWINQGAGDN